MGALHVKRLTRMESLHTYMYGVHGCQRNVKATEYNFLRPNSIFTCHPVSLVKIFMGLCTCLVVGLKLNTYPNPALVVAMDEPVPAVNVMLVKVQNVIG